MCQTGGPRCASHLRPQLNEAKREWVMNPESRSFIAKANIDNLQQQYDGTRTGKRELQEQIENAPSMEKRGELLKRLRNAEARRERDIHVGKVRRANFAGLKEEKKAIHGFLSRSDTKDHDTDLATFYAQQLEDSGTPFTENEKQNYASLGKLAQALDTDKPDWDEVKRIQDSMLPMRGREYGDNAHCIADLSRSMPMYKRAELAPPPSPAPQREGNEHLIGLQDAQVQAMRAANMEFDIGGKPSDRKPYLGKFTAKDVNETLNRVAAGEKYKSIHDPQFREYESGGMIPKHDRLLREMEEQDQFYYATRFPENELKDEMEKVGVTNVSVGSFYNTREWGNTYTVITPDGGTKTFSVYEHRNSDSLIINGKSNWNGEGLPYAGDTSHQYFAEIDHGERKRAARTLAYFMKEAQNGTLDDDATLVRNAPRMDWNSILSKRIAGYGEWAKEQERKPREEND